MLWRPIKKTTRILHVILHSKTHQRTYLKRSPKITVSLRSKKRNPYFLPLENPTGDWNKVAIYEMITLHDIDEIETGDTIGYLKTYNIRDGEKIAKLKVLDKSPHHLK